MKTFSELGIDVRGRASGQVKTLCKKCSHQRKKKNDPCLSVNLDSGLYNCHNCGWAGSLNENGNYQQKPQLMNEKTFKKLHYQPPQELPIKAYDFLVDVRSIPEHILIRNKVGFFNGVIKFPFIKNGEVVNIKSRTLDKKLWLEKNAEIVFYGYDHIDNELTIITEGEIDKLSMEVAGFPNSVSVPHGAPQVGTQNYLSKFDFL